jgi:glucose/arabinose dehydrogenase
MATLLIAAAVSTPQSCGTAGSPSGSATPITVTGTEHIAWDQSSPDGQVLTYSYVAYVDAVRQLLPGATCTPSSSDNTQASCLSPLPHMAAGSHTLQLAAVAGAAGVGAESPMSAPLNIVVTSATAIPLPPVPLSSPQGAAPASAIPATAADGTSFEIATIAASLDMPSAIAVLPDGRVLVAEAAGDIRVWRDGELLPQPALQLSGVSASAADVGLVGMTTDPEFARTQQLYLAYTARAPDAGFVNRLVRVRLVGDTLHEPVVLLEDPVAEPPQRTPRLRFGPDRKLYVTFPAGRDAAAAQDPGTYAGKVLRLNADGTTPADNPGYTPIVSSGHRAVVFDWASTAGAAWIGEHSWSGTDWLQNGWPATNAVYRFESPVDPSDAAYYPGEAIVGFHGNLFIAALGGQHIRRVRFDPRDPTRVIASERLLDGLFGRIADVVSGPDQAIYFCTANAATGTGPDRLLRLEAR